MLSALQQWYQQGWIRAIDLSLAEQLHQQTGDDSVATLAALVSYQLGQGHPCLDLAELYRSPATTLALPPEHASLDSLAVCVTPQQLLALHPGCASLSASLATLSQSVAAQAANSPLVLVGTRLYLRRYYAYEQRIKVDLQQRMAYQPDVDKTQLRTVLDALFGQSDTISWQRTACAMAMRSAFTIVTGGPGTGKTYTVVRLLATLQMLRQQAQPLRIRLAAPTGKAAARMTESISSELQNLESIATVE